MLEHQLFICRKLGRLHCLWWKSIVLNLKKPSVWDDVRRGPEAGLFQSEFLVNGKEDAANNFASGQYTVGKEIMEIVNDRLQQKIDNSENVQGFN